MEARRRKLVAAKARLGEYNFDDENADVFSGPLGGKKSNVVVKNWKTAMLGCGSNAFNQNTEDLDIMSSKLAHIQLPPCPNYSNKHYHFPQQVSCGSTVSACVTMAGDAYVWGAGYGPALRVPTLISVRQVKQISCGTTHIGLVTNDGKCYTWGSGENGMLGHGHRQSINSPQCVAAFDGMVCVQISCSAYHTAVIAEKVSKIQYVRIPAAHLISPDRSAAGTRSSSTLNGQINTDEDQMPSSPSQAALDGGAGGGETLECGTLYTFGLGKAGQLGHGNACQSSNVPLQVATFLESGLSVCRVSCGMHHTLVIALHTFNPRVFSPVLYSFGWGEHGRLGLGHEDQVNVPTQVNFPIPFHPTTISAGEQHSLAAGKQGCFSWGSNSFGQCGAGNSNSTPICLTPYLVPIPEGIRISRIAAGGRHSAAVSMCGKVVTWGWGEEGQLGNGTEKNAYLPKPCKIPRVVGCLGNPLDVSLGLCNTIVIVSNKNFDYTMDTPPPKKAEPQEEFEKFVPSIPSEPEPEPLVIEKPNTPPPRTPEPLLVIRKPIQPEKQEEVCVIDIRTPIPKTPVLDSPLKIDTPVRTPVVVNSLSDILKSREERSVMKRYSSEGLISPMPLSPIAVQAPPINVAAPVVEEIFFEETELEIKPELNTKKPPKVYDYDPKLNTAYRAELRKQQKQAREGVDTIAQGSVTSVVSKLKISNSHSSIGGSNSGSAPNSARRNSGSSSGVT